MRKSKIILAIVSLFIISCEVNDEQKIEIKRKQNLSEIKRVKENIIYFKDEKTGICFAYVWIGSEHGGPALTVVPEEKVKDFLVK